MSEHPSTSSPEQRKSIEEWVRDYGYLFEGKQIEREKDRAILKLTFVRHGEKELTSGAESQLTDRGIFEAAIIGAKRQEKDSININYSPTARTKKTAEIAQLSEKIDGEVTENELLGYKDCISREFIDKLLDIKRKMLPTDGSEPTAEEKKRIDEEAGSLQLKEYLSYGNQRPDENTLSPKEFSGRIAEIIRKYIQAIQDQEKYTPNSLHEVINVAHDINLAAFLAFTVPGFEHTISLRPGEGFEVIIKGPKGKGDDKQDIELSIFFRGKEYPLDLTIFDDEK